MAEFVKNQKLFSFTTNNSIKYITYITGVLNFRTTALSNTSPLNIYFLIITYTSDKKLQIKKLT